jgi:hypothetical protein
MSKPSIFGIRFLLASSTLIAACTGNPDRAAFNPNVDPDITDGGQTDARTSDAPPPDPVIEPLCGVFSTSAALPISGVKAPFSVSGDELVMAWADGSSSDAIVHIGERTSIEEPFIELGTLPRATGPFALERPTMNPQGNALVVLDAARKSFKLFERATVGVPFTASTQDTLAQVNTFAAALGAKETLHDPVWGPGGARFLFGVATKGIFESKAQLGKTKFLPPIPLSTKPELVPVNEQRRRPSGASPDYRVLFVFDEVTGQTIAAGRDGPEGDFTSFKPMGTISEVQVRANCKSLYFAESGTVKVAAQK